MTLCRTKKFLKIYTLLFRTKPHLGQTCAELCTLFWTERTKPMPCPTAHPRIGHIREYSLGGGCKWWWIEAAYLPIPDKTTPEAHEKKIYTFYKKKRDLSFSLIKMKWFTTGGIKLLLLDCILIPPSPMTHHQDKTNSKGSFLLDKLTSWPKQRAKKVLSDSPGLVNFVIGLVNPVFNLPDGQVIFFWGIRIIEELWNQFCLSKSFWD